MRILTVNLPHSYLNKIDKLTKGENSIFPSRSELIRVAVREFLIQELKAGKTFAKFPQSEFSKFYPPPVKEESKPEMVKIPWKENSQGEVIEYKQYKIIPRCELNV